MPKPLLPVGKKPMINYTVDLFSASGVKDIAILVNSDFKADFDWWLKRYYPSKKTLNIKIFAEKKPLGTFGGLWMLKNWIGKNSFFLANADNPTSLKLDKMAVFHKASNSLATIALTEVENSSEYGTVICGSDLIKEFAEKSENALSKYINSGWYMFSPEIFKYHAGLKFSMVEKNIFPKLAKEGKLFGFKFKGKWIDCGTWERYQTAQKMFKK
jgi:NDP-sugar pyrophosphorylase family protein